MHCDICPHQSKINAALEHCQLCDHGCHHVVDMVSGHAVATFEGNPAACKTCPHLKEIQKAMHPCDACEAGKLHGQVSTDAAPDACTVLAHALPNDHVSMPGVTELHPDVEDALRKALCVIFDFTPLELLLIQHVVHGRNVGTFREPLAELKERLNTRYDLSEGSTTFRAIAHEWKNKIVERFPPIGDLFDAVLNANKGGCAR